jgi:hypothetical protein
MSEPRPPERDDDDALDVRALLRRTAAKDEPPKDLLRGVQRRIRQRSRGKFYADGWSRSTSPASTYLVTSLLMLVILAVLYFAMVPAGLDKLTP